MEEEGGKEELTTGEKSEEEKEEIAEVAEEETEEVAKEEKKDVEEEAVAEETAETVPEEEPHPPPEEEMPAPTEEEEAKPPPSREKKVEEEEEIVEEKIYTIPLGKTWIMPPNKRAPKAIRIIKDFVVKHMKLEARKEEEEGEEPKRLVISNEVNERIWKRGIEKPPRNIRVRAARDKEGNITVYLAEGD